MSKKLSPFYPGRHCGLRRGCSYTEHLQTLGQHRSGTRSLHPRPFGRGGSSHGMRGHCTTCPLIRQHKVRSITQFDFVNLVRHQPYRKIAVLYTTLYESVRNWYFTGPIIPILIPYRYLKGLKILILIRYRYFMEMVWYHVWYQKIWILGYFKLFIAIKPFQNDHSSDVFGAKTPLILKLIPLS